MTFVATPEPDNTPPSVLLEFDLAQGSSTVIDSVITRNGEPIYGGIESGFSTGVVRDYVAPYNESLVYTIAGRYLPATTPDWAESWTDTGAWSGDTTKYTVANNTLTSIYEGAILTRNASNTVQKLSVMGPRNIKVSLVDAGNNTIVSITSNLSTTVIAGATTNAVSGIGSYEVSLLDGVVNVSGSGWSAVASYVGNPTKVTITTLFSNEYKLSLPAIGDTPVDHVYLDNDMYVLNTSTSESVIRRYVNGVESFKLDMKTIVGASSGAVGFTVDPSGNYYILAIDYFPVEQYAARVYKLSAAGVQQWVVSLSNANQVRPTSVSYDSSSNTLLVGQYNEFTNKGYVSRHNSTTGVSLAQYYWKDGGGPKKFGVDSTGNIYIPTGTGVVKYNSSLSQTGSFDVTYVPEQVQVDGSNNIFVLEINPSTSPATVYVKKYNSSLTLTNTFNLGNQAGFKRFSVNSTSAFALTGNALSRTLVMYTSAGAVNTTYWAGPPGSNFLSNTGLAVDSLGNLLVVDRSNSRVIKFNSAGAVTNTFAVAANPQGIAIDSANNFYIQTLYGNDDNYIYKYSSSGTGLLSWNTGQYRVDGLAFTSNDILIVTGSAVISGSNYTSLVKYNTSGVIQSQAVTFLANRVVIAIDKTTNLIFVFEAVNGIVKLMIFDYLLNFKSTVNFSGMYSANSATSDSLGNIYLAGATTSTEYRAPGETTNSTILRLKADASGQNITRFTSIPTYGVSITNIAVYGNRVMTAGDSNKIRNMSGTGSSVGLITASPVVSPLSFTETSDPVELNSDTAWLVHPSNPNLSMTVDHGACVSEGIFLQRQDSISRASNSTTHRLVGRAAPIVISPGKRNSEEYTLTFFAKDRKSIDEFTDLLDDQTPLLLQIPDSYGYDIKNAWYAVGDVTIERSANFDMTVQGRRFIVPVTEVDAPVIVVTPTRTYGSVIIEATSYTALSTLRPTYLNVLVGL